MNQIIEIIVAPDGATRLETKGFAGSNCLAASGFLEDALGKKLTDERTAEFYRPVEQWLAVQQGLPGSQG